MPRDLERFSVLPIVGAHYKGLIPPGRDRPSAATWTLLAGVPFVAGVLPWILPLRFPDSAVTAALTSCGLLASALLAVFVLLTNIRVKIWESEEWNYHHRLSRLVGFTAASSLYVVMLVVIAAMGLLVFVMIFGVPSEAPDAALLPFTSLVFLTLSHLGLTFLTVARRLFGVYHELFRSDFDPELTLVRPSISSRPADRRKAE